MKKNLFIVLILTFFLHPSIVWSETMDDLVFRYDVYYKKYSNVPFTGRITGKEQGLMKNGKKEGYWFKEVNKIKSYQGVYKNGKKEGLWITRFPTKGSKDNLKSQGHYKNGKKEGLWVVNGVFGLRSEGKYYNGERDGQWETYHFNGQLESSGRYSNGMKQNYWFFYNKNGYLIREYSGNYYDDKKISN